MLESTELSGPPNNSENPATPFGWMLRNEDIPPFLEQAFEKQPRLFQSGCFERAEFDRRAFFEILITHAWNFETLKFVKNGALSGDASLTSTYLNDKGLFTLDKLRVTRAAKSTIILVNLEWFHRGIRKLVHGLTNSGYFTGKANAYFTPANAQGFRAHWDTHDVFILQISGEKLWQIDRNQSILAPLENGKHGSPDDLKLIDPLEYHLKTGNILYIPAGYGHFARSLASDSLHVTVGFRAITWLDLLQSSLDKLAETDPLLRQSAGSYGNSQELGALELLNKAPDIIKHSISAIDLRQTFSEEIKSRRKFANLSKGELTGINIDDLLS